MNRSHRNSAIDYKSLESRKLLAGNVTVFESTHLYIRGDAQDNQFEIVVEGDQLVINGLDGTTINWQQSVPVVGATVNESGVSFAGGLRAHLGPGHDSLDVIDAHFEDMSIVYGGTGDDDIDVIGSRFDERTVIQTWHGDDSISATGSHFDETFFAMTLEGEDAVAIDNTMLAGNVIVNTGNGDDQIQSMGSHFMGEVSLLLPFDGDDSVMVENPVVGENQLGIYLGDGDDSIEGDMSQSQIDGGVQVGGQGGVDSIEMTMTDEVAENVKTGTFEVTGEVVYGQLLGDGAIPLFTTDSVPGGSDSSNAFAERFSFSEDTNIYSIAFEGSFQFFDPAEVDDFVIRIYGNNAGEEEIYPGSGLFTFNEVSDEIVYDLEFTGDQVDRVFTGRTTEAAIQNEQREVYQFTVDVDLEFEADQIYWISIYRQRPETGQDSDSYMNSFWNSFYLHYGLGDTVRDGAVYSHNGEWNKVYDYPGTRPNFRGTSFELRS